MESKEKGTEKQSVLTSIPSSLMEKDKNDETVKGSIPELKASQREFLHKHNSAGFVSFKDQENQSVADTLVV